MESHRMFRFASILIKFTTSKTRVFLDKRDTNSPSLRDWHGLLPQGVAALSEQFILVPVITEFYIYYSNDRLVDY